VPWRVLRATMVSSANINAFLPTFFFFLLHRIVFVIF
jgi:hypothetical protein